MNDASPRALRVLTQFANTQMGADLVTSLAAMSLIQARGVVAELHDIVIPGLSPVERIFPSMLSRKMDKGDIFQPAFLADLEALIALLHRRIEDGSHPAWEPDDYHINGGYDVIYYENGIAELSRATCALGTLAMLVQAAICAAQAQHAAETLIG